jgi:hypothetical protein
MLDLDTTRRIRDQLGHRRWSELGMEELASAAGLSRMTLHRRGVSREQIRGSLASLLAGEYQAAAAPALASLARAPERLALALGSVCEVDERYLGLIDGLGEDLAAIYHEPGDGEVLTQMPFTDALRRILQDGIQEGSLAVSGDLDEAATLLFNATGWTYRHMRSGHHWDASKAQVQVVRLLVAGMRA